MLKNLSPSGKRDLIARLTESAKADVDRNKTSFEKAFGAFDSIESADDLAKKIRDARSFNRQIESF